MLALTRASGVARPRVIHVHYQPPVLIFTDGALEGVVDGNLEGEMYQGQVKLLGNTDGWALSWGGTDPLHRAV